MRGCHLENCQTIDILEENHLSFEVLHHSPFPMSVQFWFWFLTRASNVITAFAEFHENLEPFRFPLGKCIFCLEHAQAQLGYWWCREVIEEARRRCYTRLSSVAPGDLGNAGYFRTHRLPNLELRPTKLMENLVSTLIALTTTLTYYPQSPLMASPSDNSRVSVDCCASIAVRVAFVRCSISLYEVMAPQVVVGWSPAPPPLGHDLNFGSAPRLRPPTSCPSRSTRPTLRPAKPFCSPIGCWAERAASADPRALPRPRHKSVVRGRPTLHVVGLSCVYDGFILSDTGRLRTLLLLPFVFYLEYRRWAERVILRPF